MEPDELIALEHEGWQALSAGPDAATAFYDRVLDHDVAMLLPGGIRLTDRAEILKSIGGLPWASYELEDPQVVQLTPDSAIVVYGAVAQREGTARYSALISSAYVRRDDGWKLALHQQTPR